MNWRQLKWRPNKAYQWGVGGADNIVMPDFSATFDQVSLNE